MWCFGVFGVYVDGLETCIGHEWHQCPPHKNITTQPQNPIKTKQFDAHGLLRQAARTCLHPSPTPTPHGSHAPIPSSTQGEGASTGLRSPTHTPTTTPFGSPIPSTLWASGFSFSWARPFLAACPYDPHLRHLFFGEEISMAARLVRF